MESQSAEGSGSARMAAAAQLPGRNGAVGHQRARVAGGARGGKDVSDRADRRCHQHAVCAFRSGRFHRAPYAGVMGLCGTLRPAAGGLHRQGRLFQPTLAPGWKTEEPGPKTETQMGRAFRELGIEWIAAHSPQAKGRIERCFGTLQDRLVKGLRRPTPRRLQRPTNTSRRNFYRNGASGSSWQARQCRRCAPAAGTGALLESTLSWVERRQVTNDYTVAWDGRRWQIPKWRCDRGCAGRRSGSSRAWTEA